MNVSLSYTLALAVFAALAFTGRTCPRGDVSSLARPGARFDSSLARPGARFDAPDARDGLSLHSATVASLPAGQLADSQQMASAGARQPAGLLGAPAQGVDLRAEPALGTRSAGGDVAGRCGSALVGFVNVTRRDDTVRLFLNVLNAPPGEHAVRLHQTADCTAFDAASAGEIWSPHGAALGGENQLGNLGNLHVDASGRGQLAFSAGAWALGSGSETDLLGRALVIHEQPGELLGGAEPDARIGCAVIDSRARPRARFDSSLARPEERLDR